MRLSSHGKRKKLSELLEGVLAPPAAVSRPAGRQPNALGRVSPVACDRTRAVDLSWLGRLAPGAESRKNKLKRGRVILVEERERARELLLASNFSPRVLRLSRKIHHQSRDSRPVFLLLHREFRKNSLNATSTSNLPGARSRINRTPRVFFFSLQLSLSLSLSPSPSF